MYQYWIKIKELKIKNQAGLKRISLEISVNDCLMSNVRNKNVP